MSSTLEDPKKLQELYLHWNQLRAPTGAVLFSILKDNDTLKVLDVSNNSFGIGGSCIAELCDFLKQNKEVVHFDLSSNSFGYHDSKEISNALKENHSIYGFHFSGNYGYVDS
jgi:Ran GTPase-activating protein (RanGAP) involved in mRNA processing and transport